jgi:hypothetical protein
MGPYRRTFQPAPGEVVEAMAHGEAFDFRHVAPQIMRSYGRQNRVQLIAGIFKLSRCEAQLCPDQSQVGVSMGVVALHNNSFGAVDGTLALRLTWFGPGEVLASAFDPGISQKAAKYARQEYLFKRFGHGKGEAG